MTFFDCLRKVFLQYQLLKGVSQSFFCLYQIMDLRHFCCDKLINLLNSVFSFAL